MTAGPRVADLAERSRALDPATSYLVQAPAGSGKTELLTQRFLALLPTVDQPEKVLAITFTRKATAEMRARVLQALEAATRGEDPDAGEHERNLRRLARAALTHSEAHGWQLLAQPQRLNIQTIDSLALSIAYSMPLLSRLGGRLTPVDEAEPLYAVAAERVLAHLGDDREPELAEALRQILQRRDASLPDCESLIAGMLARRDQWLLALPIIGSASPPWDELRSTLEEPFQREHTRVLSALRLRFQGDALLPELLALAHFACDHDAEGLAPLRSAACCDDLQQIAHWNALAQFLLTKDGAWRKSVHKGHGFPTTHRPQKERMTQLLQSLASDDALLALLSAVRCLPPCAYSEDEWTLVKSIFIVLRRAMAELRVAFAERGVIDFPEAGLGAHAALHDTGILMRQDAKIQHILVDEFQDTSRAQVSLLRTLLQDWQPGDGRTCFFVGDPMQSIYLFRGAEAQLFEQVRREGLELDGVPYPIGTLQLATNFRSTAAIVEPINAIFAQVLAGSDTETIRYAPSVSSKPAPAGDAIQLHLDICDGDDERGSEPQVERTAASVLAVIRAHMPAIAEARRQKKKYRVAVLVRARPHLVEIIDSLRREGIAFRGVKIDLLKDRPEILDLLSLLRALLHPADRVAWLAVLRAPWCGLALPALHTLCGTPAERGQPEPSVAALLAQHIDALDPDSRRRATHVQSTLGHAMRAYAEGVLAASPASLALWLERTWHALGAPHYLGAEQMANAESFFAALAQMPPHSMGALDESLNRQLDELYAEPDPEASEETGVQLMTIHNAKGLEFEVVLVPHLDRLGKRDDAPLFQWLLRRRPGAAEDELLLAPIGSKHGDQPPLYKWVGELAAQRQREEEKRLLYVACSRAIAELHLFATLERNNNGEIGKPSRGTLLHAGWDGLRSRVEAAAGRDSQPTLIPMPTPAAGLVSIAAAAAPPQMLRRMPAACFPDGGAIAVAPGPSHSEQRPIGNRLARVQGIVLHTLLEHATRQTATFDVADKSWPRLAQALLRQHGFASRDAQTASVAVLATLRSAFTDPAGQWLLRARDTALAEQSWSRLVNGTLRRQRPDRVFLGGAQPALPGSEYLWIIDYKTAAPAEGEDRDRFLSTSREQYREQLESYSDLLQKTPGYAMDGQRIRLALYHPALPHLDWWTAPDRGVS